MAAMLQQIIGKNPGTVRKAQLAILAILAFSISTSIVYVMALYYGIISNAAHAMPPRSTDATKTMAWRMFAVRETHRKTQDAYSRCRTPVGVPIDRDITPIQGGKYIKYQLNCHTDLGSACCKYPTMWKHTRVDDHLGKGDRLEHAMARIK
ncbi:predicted protein [Pyrenophora tritici-repentis Pt-1C-BFP]|uniref:Uncharacterized protein n=1 Tax=Pyrenophora tritici-repentis (strain Pt-1C-BFP) TaxID=426418 RepID=B2VQM5_PYRTR|nr:uncharacterized protein PTRG_00561 [Pyrenophora tritici-repentis Pt-1C-BFP]EDU39999.1 predicted protein [Pyrenophora tritici-repentis Pt-1C-BFP]